MESLYDDGFMNTVSRNGGVHLIPVQKSIFYLGLYKG